MRIKKIKNVLNTIIKDEKEQTIVPFLLGKPGIGKSYVVAQLAEELGYELIDLRLSQLDSCDLRGVPSVQKGDSFSKWCPPEFLPLKNSKWDGKKVILFLDEFNRASSEVLQSAFQLVYDRRVGENELVDDCKIVLAGNHGYEDNCEVNELDEALVNRVLLIDVEINVEDWLGWAKKANIHQTIINFIKNNPTYLDCEKNEKEKIRPRTWEKYSRTININDNDVDYVNETLGYLVLGPVYPQFKSFCDNQKQLSIKDILNYNSKKFANISRDKVYSLSQNLITYIKDNNVNNEEVDNIYSFISDCLSDDNKISFLNDLAIESNNENINNFIKTFEKKYPNFDEEMSEIITKSI